MVLEGRRRKLFLFHTEREVTIRCEGEATQSTVCCCQPRETHYLGCDEDAAIIERPTISKRVNDDMECRTRINPILRRARPIGSDRTIVPKAMLAPFAKSSAVIIATIPIWENLAIHPHP